jgi:hypothetical protein
LRSDLSLIIVLIAIINDINYVFLSFEEIFSLFHEKYFNYTIKTDITATYMTVRMQKIRFKI